MSADTMTPEKAARKIADAVKQFIQAGIDSDFSSDARAEGHVLGRSILATIREAVAAETERCANGCGLMATEHDHAGRYTAAKALRGQATWIRSTATKDSKEGGR